ncbi:MAG: DnaJ domain-containing protein [candidate division Zixibacteria bacterium]|nr:DnaJ domain-containing protein [candidate division Zixibacteria bacterium]
MSKDFYKTLGVAENASQDDIKKAFRKLAKQFHPDRNKGDKAAEERFKEISEAYDVLGDEKKRRQYDTMRKYGAFTGGPSFDPRHSGGFDASQFERFFRFDNAEGMDVFSELFGSIFGGGSPFRQARSRPRRRASRGRDAAVSLSVSFEEAMRGTEKTIVAKNPGAGIKQRRLRVKIPAGIADGGKIRLRGMGFPGDNGQSNGDLIVTVNVKKSEQFERRGNDIHSKVTVSYPDAVLGGKVQVKTLTRTINLTIPPYTKSGTKLRLKGMGLSVNGTQGDQYVEVVIDVPDTLTPRQKELLEELQKTFV